jgi:hypothetical protein
MSGASATDRFLATVTSVAVVAARAWSVVHDLPHSWRLMGTQYAMYHGESRAQRTRTG